MLGPNCLSEPGSQAGFDPERDASSKPTYTACAGPTVAMIPGLHGAACPRSPLQAAARSVSRCPRSCRAHGANGGRERGPPTRLPRGVWLLRERGLANGIDLGEPMTRQQTWRAWQGREGLAESCPFCPVWRHLRGRIAIPGREERSGAAGRGWSAGGSRVQ